MGPPPHQAQPRSCKSHCPAVEKILTVRLGHPSLCHGTIPAFPFELCPNPSIRRAPALLSGCILGLQSGGKALSVAEARMLSVPGLGTAARVTRSPLWICGSWRRKRS